MTLRPLRSHGARPSLHSTPIVFNQSAMKTPQTRNLTHAIVDDLGIAIIKGKIAPGGLFPEAELSERYQVSRTVLREAVKMLTAKGLIRSRPRQGTHVLPEREWNMLDPDVLRWLMERKFSYELMMDFMEVRMSIEPKAAARAAAKADPAGKLVIVQAIERMAAAERGDDDPLESDIAFHIAVLEASGNRFYRDLTGLVRTALCFSIRRSNESAGVPMANVRDHKRIADAIVAGDAKLAEHYMTKLIEGATADIARIAARKKAKA
jgi:DNA-binding FadR family transcriptional regulator